MNVVRKEGGEYPDCIVKYFNFNEYATHSESKVFFWGWSCFLDADLKKKHAHYDHRVFLDTASPCGFLGSQPDFIEKARYFTKVYTICPLTSEMLNLNGVKSEAVCFPYPEKYFQQFKLNTSPENKKYGCIYYGQIHDDSYKPMLKTIAKYNHRFTTISAHGLDQELSDLVTNYNLTTLQKWRLLNLSKSCVGINMVFPKTFPYADFYLKEYQTSDRIEEMLKSKTMPQMKTRMVESAASMTLMLAYKDKYSVIEEWFEPNKHFLYWEDSNHLNDILHDVHKNYDKYWNMVIEANKHVEQYSVSNFWRKINE
jgi:hypothetical protein